MRRILLAAGFLLIGTVTVRADDAADRAVVAKAIKAHYGDTDPRKVSASTIQIKGKVHAMGMAVEFSGQALADGPSRQKIDLEVDVAGQKFRIVNVINGDKGWARFDKETKELDKDQLAQTKDQAYVGWLATIAPLQGKQITLASVGEVTIEKKPAVGIKATSKGHPDVDLFFDKASGLLVKSEARVKDESGMEVNEETFYSEFKDVQGTKQPMKFIVKRDGKLYLEAEVTEYTLADKLDDSHFTKP